MENGASHVIVTSYVFRDGKIDFERLTALKELIGKQHLVGWGKVQLEDIIDTNTCIGMGALRSRRCWI